MLNRKLSSFLIVIIALMMPFATAAQDDAEDETGVAHRLLAIIPDTEDNRRDVSFSDLPAMFETRPGATIPESVIDLSERNVPLWTPILFGLAHGGEWLSYLFNMDSPLDYGGFDPFTGYLAAGFPPGRVELYTGIDAEAVIVAHTARDYTATERGAVTLLCPPDGCDSGTMVDIAGRDFNNVFGGNLGRTQPVIVWEDIVISAPAEGVITMMLTTIGGATPSLLDDPLYQTMANVLDDSEGRLRQFWIMSPEVLPLDQPAPGDSEPYPPYLLLAFDDRATERFEIARVILLYDDADSAESAAEVIPSRLDAESTVWELTYREMFAGESEIGTFEIDVIEDAETGLFAVAVSFIRPQPAPIPLDGGIIAHSAMSYRMLYQSVLRFDILWLIPGEEQ